MPCRLDGEPPHEILRRFSSRRALGLGGEPSERPYLGGWLPPHPWAWIFHCFETGDQVITSKRPLGADPEALPFRFQWNSDGTMLYVEAATKETRSLWRVRVDPTTLDWLSAERLTTPAGRDVAPTLSRDGYKAFSARNGGLRCWRAAGHEGKSPSNCGRRETADRRGGRGFNAIVVARWFGLAHELWRPGMDRSELLVMDIKKERASCWLRMAEVRSGREMEQKSRTRMSAKADRAVEAAVAYRQLGGTERFLTPWSSSFYFVPTDWTPDGRAVLGLFLESGAGNPPTSVALWPTSKPKAQQPERVLLSSPAGAQSGARRSLRILVGFSLLCAGGSEQRGAVAGAGSRAARNASEQWVRIARDHEWPDKPRWGADGKTIFYLEGIDIASQPVGSSIRSRIGPADWQAVRAHSLQFIEDVAFPHTRRSKMGNLSSTRSSADIERHRQHLDAREPRSLTVGVSLTLAEEEKIQSGARIVFHRSVESMKTRLRYLPRRLPGPRWVSTTPARATH